MEINVCAAAESTPPPLSQGGFVAAWEGDRRAPWLGSYLVRNRRAMVKKIVENKHDMLWFKYGNVCSRTGCKVGSGFEVRFCSVCSGLTGN